jgi:endonuclease/exonuclease/phosphatase family metal-dependent hydrolase
MPDLNSASDANAFVDDPTAAAGGQRLRLLSYNIQTGTTSSAYRHYFTHSWKHILPHPERIENLTHIAQMAATYDMVGLQEVDAGSLRSGFINQTEYLAHKAKFPFWYHQTTRRIGKLAQHSNGFLSRYRPTEVNDHKLPGTIPGRGALFLRFGGEEESLVVVVLHLALGRRARMRQLEYISEVASEYRHAIIMGDMNCRSDSEEIQTLLRNGNLSEPAHDLYTFPSWRPERNIDHILVSPTLNVQKVHVLNHTFSDHLPITMEVVLPQNVRLLAS